VEVGRPQAKREGQGTPAGRRQLGLLSVEVDRAPRDRVDRVALLARVRLTRRRDRVELQLKGLLGLFHQVVELLQAERRRLQHVVGRPRLELQAELPGLLTERRAGEDRQVEHLDLGVEPRLVQIVDAASHGVGRVARQPEDQVDPHDQSFVEHRLRPALERLEVYLAVHEPLSDRIQRLQADVHLGEAGLAQ